MRGRGGVAAEPLRSLLKKERPRKRGRNIEE